MTRVFNRFRAARTGTFVSWDGDRSELTWTPTARAEPVTEWMQRGRDVRWADFSPGDVVRVQTGGVTAHTSTMRGGPLRRASRGRSRNMHTWRNCIDHVAHPRPTVSLLCLRVMEAVLGAAETGRHLRDFADGASTRQTEAVISAPGHRGHQDLGFSMDGGRLRCGWRFSSIVSVEEDRLRISEVDLPESVIAAMVGRPLSAICDHPVLRDPDLVATSVAQSAFGCLSITVGGRAARLPVAEAIEMLAPPIAAVA